MFKLIRIMCKWPPVYIKYTYSKKEENGAYRQISCMKSDIHDMYILASLFSDIYILSL